MGTSNPLAAALAVAPGLASGVVRELWEQGGRQTSSSAPIPILASEVKALPVAAAAAAAGCMESAAELAKLWRTDSRKAVRSAIVENPRAGVEIAELGLAAKLAAATNISLSRARTVGPDKFLELVAASERNPELSSHTFKWAQWAEFLGPDRIAAHQSAQRDTRGDWMCYIAAWALLHGPETGFVSDDWVAQVWTECSNSTRSAVLEELIQVGSFSEQWLLRFQGRGTLFTRLDLRHVQARPIHVEVPELLAGAFAGVDTSEDSWELTSLIKNLHILETRMSAGSGGTGSWQDPWFDPAICDTLAAGMAASKARIELDEVEWLAARVSETHAAVLIAWMVEWLDSRTHMVGSRSTTAARGLLNRVAAGDHTPALLVASKSESLTTDWLAGKFALNQPSAETVAELLALDRSSKAVEHVTGYPELWAATPAAARAVLGDDTATSKLLASPTCPREFVDALFALMARSRPRAVKAPAWVRGLVSNAAAALNEDGWLGPESTHQLLANYEVPESLRLNVAAAHDNSLRNFVHNEIPLNPVTAASIDEAFWEYADGSVLMLLATNREAPIELRYRATLLLENPETGTLHQMVADASLRFDEMLELARRSTRVAGTWLAGAYEHNRLDDDQVAVVVTEFRGRDVDEQLEILAQYAHSHLDVTDDAPHPAVGDWLANVPGVLLRNDDVELMATVAQVVAPRFGADVAAWRLFAELGCDTSATVDATRMLVEASA